MTIFTKFQERFESLQVEEYSLKEYLELSKTDPSVYASSSERMLLGIGEQKLIDTAKDPRLSRIFSNKVIKQYDAFSDFFGMIPDDLQTALQAVAASDPRSP